MRGLLLFLLLPCLSVAQVPSLIPLPAEMVIAPGELDLECGWELRMDGDLSPGLTALLRTEFDGLQPETAALCKSAVPIDLHLFTPDTLLPPEWYALQIDADGIRIQAASEAGLFRGTRTLRQIVEQIGEDRHVPYLTITDHPRFAWRGMHLDVCRHFFGVDFVKKYIDLLARYKMNTFHWHLTDDQGWRIEIKQYPKLTEVGAWRKGSQVGPYGMRAYDSIPYGGYYTQDEIRDVVAYAAARSITVVPEIEMPGHAMAALAAYPELGCTGGPYEVQRGWGVFDDVFCTTDTVFDFLENVLTEVMDLFPSPYIHIGGDECPKVSWKACPKCQALMKVEGLKDEHELQSYFIQRMERFVNSKGRKIIGWDEILEGGLAPNAAVMSWRGTEGGVAAAQSGHYAVMTPGDHCYFDHYQGDPANEPLAIGGYTTVQKVYSYEPVPAELKGEEAKYILGAQANLWTEYILTPEHVEYMMLPRMLALAEVTWSPKELRNEADFLQRLFAEFPRLEALGADPATSIMAATITPSQGLEPGTIRITLKSAMPGPITYDSRPVQKEIPSTPSGDASAGSAPAIDALPYESPFILAGSTRVTGVLHVTDGIQPKASTQLFNFNKATARPITLSVPPEAKYSTGGAFTLVDGVSTEEKRVNSQWLAWRKSVTITVDLGSVQKIQHASVGAWNETPSWIHLPAQVVVSVSADGKHFTAFGTATGKNVGGRQVFGVDSTAPARFVRFEVKNPGTIPAGFAGAGYPAYVFLDEVDVH